MKLIEVWVKRNEAGLSVEVVDSFWLARLGRWHKLTEEQYEQLIEMESVKGSTFHALEAGAIRPVDVPLDWLQE